jgi:hypothetical protein
MSLHKTKEGAEKAMEAHKALARIEYEEYLKRHVEHTEEYCIEENLDDETKKTLIESVSPFGAHEDWAVEEMEVLED